MKEDRSSALSVAMNPQMHPWTAGIVGIALSTASLTGNATDAAPRPRASDQKITRIAPHLQGNQVPVEAWTFAADTQIQSVNLGDTSGSLGFGVGRQTEHTDATIIIRRATADSLQGTPGAAAFGQFVLTPATAKLGLTMRAEVFPFFGPYKCIYTGDTTSEAAATQGGCAAGYTQGSTLRPGLLASLDFGVADFAPSDPMSTLPRTTATAMAATLGLLLRSEGQFQVAGATNPIMGAIFVAGTLRAVGGDLNGMLRSEFLLNDAQTYWGAEFGGIFRIATLEVVGKGTFLAHSGTDVAGLTGLHFVPTISFRLPFDVVTQSAPKQPSGSRDSDTMGNVKAASPPAAPATPSPPVTPASP